MKKKNDYLERLKPLIQFGFKSAEVEYSGGGDSGEVEDVTIVYNKRSVSKAKGHEFTDTLSDICYDELEKQYGGWEINDGSSGVFNITFDGRHIEYWIDHVQNYMETEESSSEKMVLDVAKI